MCILLSRSVAFDISEISNRVRRLQTMAQVTTRDQWRCRFCMFINIHYLTWHHFIRNNCPQHAFVFPRESLTLKLPPLSSATPHPHQAPIITLARYGHLQLDCNFSLSHCIMNTIKGPSIRAGNHYLMKKLFIPLPWSNFNHHTTCAARHDTCSHATTSIMRSFRHA